MHNYCSEIENHQIYTEENKIMHSKRNEADDIRIYYCKIVERKKVIIF